MTTIPWPDGHSLPEAARGRLYRVLGQAVKARDMALNWEGPAGANLIRNLCHLAFMGHGMEVIDSLAGAALFCSESALPTVLEAGIRPTAVGATNPGPGPLWGYEHPWLMDTPLVAEEVAYASTVKAYPGSRFLCLGPCVTLPGLFRQLVPAFTPQHHCLSRLAEVATLAGCQPLILVGADLR